MKSLARKIISPAFVLHTLLIVSGWDRSAFDFFGFSVRLAWLCLPLLAFYAPNIRVPVKYFLYIMAFFFLHVFSAVLSSSPARGMAYSFWIIFSYYFFFAVAFRCAGTLGTRVFDVFILNGRIQILCAALLFFAGVHDRATFIYYEPSYMAIALIPYVALCFFGNNSKLLDYLFVVLFLVVSQSANFILVIFFISACKVFSLRNSKHFLLIGGSVVGLLVCGFVYLYLDESNINHALVVGIVNGGINLDTLWLLVERGGNRVPRMKAAYDVFVNNFFFGVGPSNYINYTSNMDFSYVKDGAEWIDPEGKPPTNAFLEAGLNAGLLSLVMLLGIFIYGLLTCAKIKDFSLRWVLFSIVLVMFLMLQLDSNYLRAYCWVTMGAVFCLCGKSAHVLSEAKKNTAN